MRWRVGAGYSILHAMSSVRRYESMTGAEALALIGRLFAHLEWADARAVESIRRSPNDRALELLAHVLGAEHVWLSRITGTPPQVAVWPALSIEECAALAAELQAEFRTLLASLDATSAERVIHYRNSAGDAYANRVSDILLHVVLHGMYHRGQVALVLRGSGGEPVPGDYIAFVRGAPAATRASAANRSTAG